MQSVGLLSGQETERRRMKVYTNIVDVISLCALAGGRVGGDVRLVSIVVQGGRGGAGWDVVCECSSKAEGECSCSVAAEESGRAVFWRAGSHVLIPHLCHHPQPHSSLKKNKRHYKKETNACCTVKTLHVLPSSSCCEVLLLALLPFCTTVIFRFMSQHPQPCLSLYESIHTAALQTSGTCLALKPREAEEDQTPSQPHESSTANSQRHTQEGQDSPPTPFLHSYTSMIAGQKSCTRLHLESIIQRSSCDVFFLLIFVG